MPKKDNVSPLPTKTLILLVSVLILVFLIIYFFKPTSLLRSPEVFVLQPGDVSGGLFANNTSINTGVNERVYFKLSASEDIIDYRGLQLSILIPTGLSVSNFQKDFSLGGKNGNALSYDYFVDQVSLTPCDGSRCPSAYNELQVTLATEVPDPNDLLNPTFPVDIPLSQGDVSLISFNLSAANQGVYAVIFRSPFTHGVVDGQGLNLLGNNPNLTGLTMDVTFPLASSPTFSPDGGSFNNDTSVTLSSTTSGASILYCFGSGCDPLNGGLIYSSPISVVADSTVIRAITQASGFLDSSIASSNLFTLAVASPTLNTLSTRFNNSIIIDADTLTINATLHYTLDGSIPNSLSPQLPVTLTDTSTLSIIGIKNGYVDSNVVTATFTKNNLSSVIISSPLGGSTFVEPENITINVAASDSDGSVSEVQFFEGSKLLVTDTTSPYSFNWNNVSAGNYILTATAIDNEGLTATSAPVSITVSPNQLPTVSITSPSSGAIFTSPANITITANATDVDGSISKVEFYEGGIKLGEDNTSVSTFTYIWNNVSTGIYTLTALAYDDKGGSNISSAISINVENPNVPPTISVISPLDGAKFLSIHNVILQVTAQDSDGTTARVEFYLDDIKQNDVLTAPYSYNFGRILTKGSHTLKAIAVDNDGDSSNSIQVSVVIYDGDLNNDTLVNIADVTLMIQGIFFGPSTTEMDLDFNGGVDLIDILKLLEIIFFN